MSAHHPNVARRQSKSSDEPYLYESFTKAYDNGKKPGHSEGRAYLLDGVGCGGGAGRIEGPAPSHLRSEGAAAAIDLARADGLRGWLLFDYSPARDRLPARCAGAVQSSRADTDLRPARPDPSPRPPDRRTDGNYTQQDCLRLAKTLTDMAQVPVPCKEVVQKELAVRKAFEGASVTDRARQAIASRKGSVSHHQLQRRLTRTSEVMSR